MGEAEGPGLEDGSLVLGVDGDGERASIGVEDSAGLVCLLSMVSGVV